MKPPFHNFEKTIKEKKKRVKQKPYIIQEMHRK